MAYLHSSMDARRAVRRKRPWRPCMGTTRGSPICCCSSGFQKPLGFLVFPNYWAPLGHL
ncbi:hypothetical protein V6Z11_A07G137000 [Gossypium hirsutum]